MLGAHLLFRTAYAAVNVPYLAMTARISADPGDRAFVAGMRMLFGTAAAVVVALCTVPIGRWLTGSTASEAYFGAAVLFAVIGAAILVLVGATYRECAPIERPLPGSVKDALVSLSRNRAFVTLSAAMMAMIVAITVLNKSVLYYFKYLLNDPEAGQLALASMGIVSAIAIPLWMLLGRVLGLRALWLLAAGLGIAGLLVFAAIDVHRTGLMQIFLIAMQVMIVGLNFVFWAMLPNTIEYGEQATGVHVEGTVFGVAALLAAHRHRHRHGDPRLELRVAPATSRTCSKARRRSAGMRSDRRHRARRSSWPCRASRCCSIRSDAEPRAQATSAAEPA